ncbi:MAG: tetratricopeptide repeat protein [Planctomycetota bacterium]
MILESPRARRDRRRPPRRDRSPAPGSPLRLLLVVAVSLLPGCLAEPPPPVTAPPPAEELSAPLRGLLEEQLSRITAAPRVGAERGRLGMIYEANGLLVRGASAYRNAARLDPSRVEWGFHALLCAAEAGESEGLQSGLEELLSRHPGFAPGQHLLGRLHLEAGDLDAAEARFRVAREQVPTLSSPWIALSQLALLRGLPEEALTLAEEAVRIAPRAISARHARGRALQALGRDEEAAPDLALEVRGPPRRPPDGIDGEIATLAVGISTAVDRGADLIDAGRSEDAIRHFRSALRDHPGNPELRTNLSVALLRVGRAEEARSELEALLSEKPGDLGILLNLAEALWQLKEFGAGVEVARRLAEAHPEAALAHFALGRAEYGVGNTEAGLAASRRAASLDPGDARFHAGVAEGCVAKSDPAGAAAAFELAVALEPNSLPYRANLCALLLHLRRIDEAREQLTRLEAMAPQDPRVRALSSQLSGATRPR